MNMMLGYKVLDTKEIQAIVDSAFQLLEKTGVKVENSEILNVLAGHGGVVDKTTQKVHFKKEFMESFLAGSKKIDWENRPVEFSAAAEIYQGYYLDPEDGNFKEWTEQRLLEYVKIAKALPDLNGVSMPGCPIKEVPQMLQPLYEKLYCWKYGIYGGSAIWETSLCPKIHEMWQVYADETGQDIKDIYNGTVYLISPLKFGSVEAEQFMWFYNKGLAARVGTLGSLGGTTPVTLAGALALHIAETLFINILNRAFFGSKVLKMGNFISVMDMSSGAFQYGRPEQTLLSLAGAQIARYLGAQYEGHGGLTDAKAPGHEAGVQKVSSAILNAVSCGHGNIAASLLGVDEIFSPVQMILDDEITGSVKRICRGSEVNEETLALDVIDEIGPGGNFLDTDHTAVNFRESLWQPSIFKTYNAYPAPGDRHITEFFTERFPGGKYYGKTLGINAYSFEGTIEFGEKIHKEAVEIANTDDPLTEDFFNHMHGEHEQLMEIINSIENDSRKVFSVNMPNNCAVPNLPKDAVLEIPAAATAKGFCPLQINDFPDVLAGIVSKHLVIVEVTVEAALKGNRSMFEEAILMGGYISDRNEVGKMVDELIRAQAKYLPQFK